jgi:hypothetical protein
VSNEDTVNGYIYVLIGFQLRSGGIEKCQRTNNCELLTEKEGKPLLYIMRELMCRFGYSRVTGELLYFSSSFIIHSHSTHH